MRWLDSISIFTCLFFCIPLYSQHTYVSPTIRVLIARYNIKSTTHMTLSLPAECHIALKKNQAGFPAKINSLVLTIAPHTLHIAPSYPNTPLTSFFILPTKKPISFNNNCYDGALQILLRPKHKEVLIINHVDIEDYLYSVLRYESYQSWPAEMQRVQAITSRTYALYYRKRNTSLPYDVTSSNAHQTYKGLHPYTHLRQAIADTRDTVMLHDNQLILAMFDACCGGVVPANMKRSDFKKMPYLSRPYRCQHCKNYKLHSWKQRMNIIPFMGTLAEHPTLNAQLHSIGMLKKIQTNRDNAGIAQNITLHGTLGQLNLDPKIIMESMNLKSKNFDIKKGDQTITITGCGFGHQLGLCQRGAHTLVSTGWHHKDILRFYYPGITFAKLTRICPISKKKTP